MLFGHCARTYKLHMACISEDTNSAIYSALEALEAQRERTPEWQHAVAAADEATELDAMPLAMLKRIELRRVEVAFIMAQVRTFPKP